MTTASSLPPFQFSDLMSSESTPPFQFPKPTAISPSSGGDVTRWGDWMMERETQRRPELGDCDRAAARGTEVIFLFFIVLLFFFNHDRSGQNMGCIFFLLIWPKPRPESAKIYTPFSFENCLQHYFVFYLRLSATSSSPHFWVFQSF